MVVWDPLNEREIVLLTNILHFGPTTIAAIYKDRWEIPPLVPLAEQLSLNLG